jgi:hypothetical protein
MMALSMFRLMPDRHESMDYSRLFWLELGRHEGMDNNKLHRLELFGKRVRSTVHICLFSKTQH